MREVQASEDQRLRAFIAIELPAAVREALRREAARLQAALGEASLRWVRPEGVHLTLRFLGDITPALAEGVGAALSPLCGRCSPLALQVGGLGSFPDGTRPRVVWVGVHEAEGRLAALQAEIEHAMADLGMRAEGRPFHPHLTLARARREAGPSELRRLGEQLARERVDQVAAFEGQRVALIRSVLGQGGAIYSRLRAFELSGAV